MAQYQHVFIAANQIIALVFVSGSLSGVFFLCGCGGVLLFPASFNGDVFAFGSVMVDVVGGHACVGVPVGNGKLMLIAGFAGNRYCGNGFVVLKREQRISRTRAINNGPTFPGLQEL